MQYDPFTRYVVISVPVPYVPAAVTDKIHQLIDTVDDLTAIATDRGDRLSAIETILDSDLDDTALVAVVSVLVRGSV